MVCFLGALLLLAARERAAAQEFRPNLSHWCQEGWMLPRSAVLRCLDRDREAADAELNRVYQQRLAALSPEAQERLRSEQRAWLRRYDATLTAYYSQPWANHSRVKVLPSQIRALRDRAEYLRDGGGVD